MGCKSHKFGAIVQSLESVSRVITVSSQPNYFNGLIVYVVKTADS